LAYWNFDEININTAPDSSGNGNDGIIYGAETVDGILENALNFDGIDDYVDIGNDISLKPFRSFCFFSVYNKNGKEGFSRKD
jgi:hypothetical protein